MSNLGCIITAWKVKLFLTLFVFSINYMNQKYKGI